MTLEANSTTFETGEAEPNGTATDTKRGGTRPFPAT